MILAPISLGVSIKVNTTAAGGVRCRAASADALPLVFLHQARSLGAHRVLVITVIVAVVIPIITVR